MTGSFVIAGMQFFRSEVGALAKLLAIPSFFLAGVAVTVLVHPLRERPHAALARSLGIECLLLLGFLAACFVPFAAFLRAAFAGCLDAAFLGAAFAVFLGAAFAVADVDEDEAAEVAARMDPTGQSDGLADVRRAQLVAMMRSFHEYA